MALAKLFGKPKLQQVPTADGDAAFDPKVVESYSQLFKAVDHDADGRIGGQEGALFLRRSRLDDDVLREVGLSNASSRLLHAQPHTLCRFGDGHVGAKVLPIWR